MEYSTNFNFSLPSRDNDIDLADINEISNNFRKIDENAVKKEVGKGLSTNDFTNEEKERLANAPTDITLTDKHLQLTANGKAVGNGVTIPAPQETFVKTYFDYTKLKDVSIGNLKAFSIKHNLDETNTKNVYIRFELIKDKLDESTGVLVVKPVLSGLPSVIYGSTGVERTFDSNEKVGITLRLGFEDKTSDVPEEDFKEIFTNENTVVNIDFDNEAQSFTVIRFECRAEYNDIGDADYVKLYLSEEILPMFRGMHVAIDKVEWTEKESELVYVE